VLKESTLVNLYRACRDNIERNLHLKGLTTRHAPPDMTKTLAKMANYLKEHGPNEHRPGRKTAYSIPDMIDLGQLEIARTSDPFTYTAIAGMDDEGEYDIEEEDITAEL
jgi:hypothetical protein